MLKITGLDVLLAAAGSLYLLLALGGICFALWIGKTWNRKLVYAVIALALFISPIAPEMYRAIEHRGKLAEAQSLFEERCKTAGERIYRTVDDVDGVLLLNIRQYDRPGVADNPLWPDAALPLESGGDDYLRSFLYREYDGSPYGRRLAPGERGFLSIGVDEKANAMSRGYRFVDVRQPDGSVLRYRLKEQNKPDLMSEHVKETARYALGFVNQIKPSDRKLWVAGTVMTLTDTQKNEVIATRESYSFEPGLGSTAGGRQPWRFAVTCPANSRKLPSEHLSRFFVDQIVKPSQVE